MLNILYKRIIKHTGQTKTKNKTKTKHICETDKHVCGNSMQANIIKHVGQTTQYI